jgi:hypothetical protein
LTILDAILPYRQNDVRGNDPFEVRKGVASTLFTGPGIADVKLFGILKQTQQSIDISNEEELKSDILTIFRGIPSDELKKSFNHWMERCQWAATNAGKYYLSWP